MFGICDRPGSWASCASRSTIASGDRERKGGREKGAVRVWRRRPKERVRERRFIDNQEVTEGL